GIAAYFGWDATLVRVIFAIAVLAGGWGIGLYLVLWLVMPQAKSTSQKMEMRGAAVTLKEFEQTAKEKISEVQKSGAVKNIFTFFGKAIKFFLKIILAIIGASITF